MGRSEKLLIPTGLATRGPRVQISSLSATFCWKEGLYMKYYAGKNGREMTVKSSWEWGIDNGSDVVI